MKITVPSEMIFPGRVYGTEWSIENVARRLRSEAVHGFLGGFDLREDAVYRRKCSARHVPSRCSVIFTRDNVPLCPKGYHASVCFIGVEEYMPWNDEIAEKWLVALYGGDRPRVIGYGALTSVGSEKGVRHFMLEVEQW
jgi:hypothetical protein